MESFKKSQPVLGEKILRWTLPSDEVEALLGDFDEIYDEMWKKKGRFAAKSWYWLQIFRLLPSFIKNMIYWSGEMLKNYFKVAFRNIKRNKVFSMVNLLGVALGMSCSFLIFLIMAVAFFQRNFTSLLENSVPLRFITPESQLRNYTESWLTAFPLSLQVPIYILTVSIVIVCAMSGIWCRMRCSSTYPILRSATQLLRRRDAGNSIICFC